MTEMLNIKVTLKTLSLPGTDLPLLCNISSFPPKWMKTVYMIARYKMYVILGYAEFKLKHHLNKKN